MEQRTWTESSPNDRTVASHGELTRKLLRCGVVAGPIYLIVGLTQALTREGFDLSRHALSHLANGPGGWIQTLNLAVTGALVIAAAAGISRSATWKSRLPWWLLGTYGAAMLLAAVFPADPVDGFPPGTPEGMPASISTAGLLHFVFGGLGFLMLALSCLFAARAFSLTGQVMLSRLSLASGLVVLIGFFGGVAAPLGVFGIWAAVVMGWVWLSVVCWRQREFV